MTFRRPRASDLRRQRRHKLRTSLEFSGHGHIEPLEYRRLLAGVPELVRDINPLSASSDSTRFTEVGSTLYFTATDGTNGRELWKSDGTEAGTVLVKDIFPGSTSSFLGHLTNVGGTLFFSATDGSNGVELWKSDGTAAGTVRVKDIRAGANSSNPSYLTNVGGTLFFSASDGTNGYELWKSNGTEAGTVRVKDIRPGVSSSYPGDLTNVGGTLFFRASDGTNGVELWKSNGTEAGTVRVKDILPGLSGSSPQEFTNVGGALYFSATDGANGYELWKSDGTEAGTVLVKDIWADSDSSYPHGMTNVGGTLFFSARDSAGGYELWKSNGTAAGTVRVKDIFAGDSGSNPGGLTNVSGALFFSAANGINSGGLWKSDGTEAGTVLVKSVSNSLYGSTLGYLTNVNGTLFFRATDEAHGEELWQSNGTEAGTVLVKDLFAGNSNSSPGYLTNVGGTLFFNADDGIHGEEVWKVTVGAAPAALPFADDFNRSNGTSLGANWTETLGNLGITNQRVVLFQNTESTAVLSGLTAADVSLSAQVDLSTAEVGRSVALMARSQGPGDANAYWGVYYRSDSGYAAQIYKNINGVTQALRSVSVAGPSGNLRFEVFGTTLNLYFNDSLVTSVVDDSLLSPGTMGIRQTGGALDNFAAAVAIPPPIQSAVLPFSDNFNRPDNSLFGPFWTERSGDTGVRGNAAGLYANDTSVVTLNGVSESDVSVSADIDITGVPAQFSSGLLARHSGPGDSNTYMARLFRSDSGNYAAQIWKSVDGQYSPLRSVIVSSGAGNLRFEVVGDQLRLFFDHVLVASTIDTSLSGPGMVGMRLLGGTADNFSAAALELPPTSDASLPFLDTFTRADDSSLGEFWTERAGDLGISNQQMVTFAAALSVATLNGISESDLEVSADIDLTQGGNAGLLARYTGPGDANAYLALLQPGGGGTFAAQIWKNTGGGWQNLTHSQLSVGVGQLRFRLEGDHLQLFFDEILVGDVMDSSLPGAGTVGVRLGGGTIDNFAAALLDS